MMLPEKDEDQIAHLKRKLKSYSNFRGDGTKFWDIYEVLKDPMALHESRHLLAGNIERSKTARTLNIVVAIESGGLALATMVAHSFCVPLIAIRKGGKLPGETYKADFKSLYESGVLEMQKDGLKEGQKVVIIDDMISTGGQMKAACDLVGQAKAEVLLCISLVGPSEVNMPKLPAPALSIVNL